MSAGPEYHAKVRELVRAAHNYLRSKILEAGMDEEEQTRLARDDRLKAACKRADALVAEGKPYELVYDHYRNLVTRTALKILREIVTEREAVGAGKEGE